MDWKKRQEGKHQSVAVYAKKKKKRKNDGGLTEIISAEIEKCKQIQDIF